MISSRKEGFALISFFEVLVTGILVSSLFGPTIFRTALGYSYDNTYPKKCEITLPRPSIFIIVNEPALQQC